MSLSTINPSSRRSQAEADQLSTVFAERLVTLSDGRPGLRGGIHVEVSAPRQDPSATPGGGIHVDLRTPGASPAPPSSGAQGENPPSRSLTPSGHPLPLRGGEGRGEGPVRQAEIRGEGNSPLRANSCLDFISSDETLDRYGEIISAAGWNLANYLRNPVFQNSHQYGDIIFTLGKALITDVRQVAGRQVLFQRIQFAVEASPMARIAHALYSGGFLKTVSVGFIPIRWEDGTVSSSSSFSSSSSPPFRRRFLEQELLEVSAVSIPANPNALALGLKSGAVEKADLRDTFDLLRQTLAHPASAHPLPIRWGEGQGEGNFSGLVSQPSTIDYRPLYQLARQLRDLMRHT